MVDLPRECRITKPFPTPPGAILLCLERLAILERGDPEEMAGHDLSDLERPWEPAACSDELRETIWYWVDVVVVWLNCEFGWRTVAMIPECWVEHPHIARELPVVAILRWQAEIATGPVPMEEWHRYTWPMFCDRMQARLEGSECRQGKHTPWLGESRYHQYCSAESGAYRDTHIIADTRPATPIRADA